MRFEFVVFEVIPNFFIRIEFWSIRREIVKSKMFLILLYKLLHALSPMHGCSVYNNNDFPRGMLPHNLFKKIDKSVCINSFLFNAKYHAPCGAHSRRYTKASAITRYFQGWRFASRCPCPSQYRNK